MKLEETLRRRDSLVPAAHGFDFSIEEMFAYSKHSNDPSRLTETDLNFDQWLATHRAVQKEPQAA